MKFQILNLLLHWFFFKGRVSKNTNLIYTTSGFLLRTIMADQEETYRKITHLIIDEIHERDKYTDFTLIAIKDQLKINKNLRVILMSATMDINLLSQYFDNCPVLNVPGKNYEVKIYHLEEILFHSGFRTDLMTKHYNAMKSNPQNYNVSTSFPINGMQNDIHNDIAVKEPIILEDQYMQELLDRCIEQCYERNNMEELYEVFDQIQYYIESEDVPVDVGHSKYRKSIGNSYMNIL